MNIKVMEISKKDKEDIVKLINSFDSFLSWYDDLLLERKPININWIKEFERRLKDTDINFELWSLALDKTSTANTLFTMYDILETLRTFNNKYLVKIDGNRIEVTDDINNNVEVHFQQIATKMRLQKKEKAIN
ncbi:MAG: hypothetical protein HDS11_02925 [Bacteroides sp.]|nr:hypothetical protein [Bacteroides sp.]